MASSEHDAADNIIIFVILLAVFIMCSIITTGVIAGAAWLTVAVVAGFGGPELPYWPTVGAGFLLLLFAWFARGVLCRIGKS